MSLDFLSSIPNYEELPAGSPPPGITPNFANPESRAYQAYIVAAICLPILVGVVGVRAYAKSKLLKKRSMDDIPFFIAAAACITYTVLVVVIMANGGFGVHTWDIKLKVLNVGQLRLSLGMAIIYGPILWSTKVPLLLMYLEVFRLIKWVKWTCWTALVLTGIYNFANMIVMAVSCSPNTGTGQLDYLSALVSPSCEFAAQTFSLVSGGINVTFDVFLLILPLQPIWALQLSTQRKWAISALVFTGILAIISSCVALWYRILTQQGATSATTDNTWNATPLWVAITAEMTCAMIIAAAPSISVFWTMKLLPLSSKLTSIRERLMSSYDTVTNASTLKGKSSDSDLDLPLYNFSKDNSAITMTREYSVQRGYDTKAYRKGSMEHGYTRNAI